MVVISVSNLSAKMMISEVAHRSAVAYSWLHRVQIIL